MFRVVVDDDARDQIDALPDSALEPYADAMDFIEIAPWSGRSLHKENPDGNVRRLSFGQQQEGFVVYLIVEPPPEVHVLMVRWLGL